MSLLVFYPGNLGPTLSKSEARHGRRSGGWWSTGGRVRSPGPGSGAAQPHWVLGRCWGLNVSTDERLQSSPAPCYPGSHSTSRRQASWMCSGPSRAKIPLLADSLYLRWTPLSELHLDSSPRAGGPGSYLLKCALRLRPKASPKRHGAASLSPEKTSS